MKIAIQLFAALLIWNCIAYLHLMAGYFDSLPYRPERQLSRQDFYYYSLAYSCWALLSVALFHFLKMLPSKHIKISYLVTFTVGLLTWLPLYFLADFFIASKVKSEPLGNLFERLLATPYSLLFFYAMMFALTFGVCTSILLYRNAKAQQLSALKLEALQSEIQLTQANQKLQLLQSQLSPHFLFNCLNAISGLVRTGDKDRLLEAIGRIGNLLRYTVHTTENTRILLSEELEFVDNYIALQKLRFQERFLFTIDIKVEESQILVPPLLIQPLIENAFTHSVALSAASIAIELTVVQEMELLKITVINDDTGNSVDTNHGMQSALANLQARLKVAFLQSYEFQTQQIDNKFVSQLTLSVEPM